MTFKSIGMRGSALVMCVALTSCGEGGDDSGRVQIAPQSAAVAASVSTASSLSQDASKPMALTAAAAPDATLAAAAMPKMPLRTAGPYMVDADGRRVRLNAVNWYGAEGSNFAVMGLQAQSLATIVDQIKSRGYNAVRLPWSNQMYETNPVVSNAVVSANPGMVGQRAMTIYDTVVRALTDAGIMVILDNHVSTARWCCNNDVNNLWYNSAYPEENWLSDWKGMVTRYKANNLVVGVDLRNEPRVSAVWGGGGVNDWHAAATRGGNAVLSINPKLLVFVEGINYARNLSGVANTPVALEVPNKVVYSAHDYSFHYSGLTGYSDWYSRMYPLFGYLVTGNNPKPLWIGEFGTCNTASTCVSSTSNASPGYWYAFFRQFLLQYSVDWSYWAVNGTTETGHGGGFGSAETYGILNTSWNGDALSALSSDLQGLSATGGGPPAGTYQITNVNSGLSMEVLSASKNPGAPVDQYSWNGRNNQKWKLAYLANGLYTLTNVGSGQVLDVQSQSTSPGGKIDQYTSNGGANQQFIVSRTAAGNYKIIGSQSGLAVEVPGSSTSLGVQLDQASFKAGVHQEWQFTPR